MSPGTSWSAGIAAHPLSRRTSALGDKQRCASCHHCGANEPPVSAAAQPALPPAPRTSAEGGGKSEVPQNAKHLLGGIAESGSLRPTQARLASASRLRSPVAASTPSAVHNASAVAWCCEQGYACSGKLLLGASSQCHASNRSTRAPLCSFPPRCRLAASTQTSAHQFAVRSICTRCAQSPPL